MNAHPSIKAYAVLEECENTGGIVFARHPITARRQGAAEYNGGEFDGVICHRAPWADEFATTGRVPARVMIEHGWHFECAGCGMRIDEDTLYEARLPLDRVIGTQNSRVYCCARCRRKHYSLERRRRAEEQRAIDAFKTVVRNRLPEAVFCDNAENPNWRHHAYVTVDASRGGWHWEQVSVAFTFPGMTIAPATYSLPQRPWRGYGGQFIGPLKPAYRCCSGDRQAFEAWASKP